MSPAELQNESGGAGRGARLLVCTQKALSTLWFIHIRHCLTTERYCYASISSLTIKFYESTLNIACSIQST